MPESSSSHCTPHQPGSPSFSSFPNSIPPGPAVPCDCSHNPSPLCPLSPGLPDNFTNVSFAVPPRCHPRPIELSHMDDIITTWGAYTTLEDVRASPFYARVEIPVNPRHYEQWRNNPVSGSNVEGAAPPGHFRDTFTLYAVLPIPVRYLSQMSSPQLQYLSSSLWDEYYDERQRFRTGDSADPDYEESVERMMATISRIQRICEQRVDEAVDSGLSSWSRLSDIAGTLSAFEGDWAYAHHANKVRSRDTRHTSDISCCGVESAFYEAPLYPSSSHAEGTGSTAGARPGHDAPRHSFDSGYSERDEHEDEPRVAAAEAHDVGGSSQSEATLVSVDYVKVDNNGESSGGPAGTVPEANKSTLYSTAC